MGQDLKDWLDCVRKDCCVARIVLIQVEEQLQSLGQGVGVESWQSVG